MWANAHRDGLPGARARENVYSSPGVVVVVVVVVEMNII